METRRHRRGNLSHEHSRRRVPFPTFPLPVKEIVQEEPHFILRNNDQLLGNIDVNNGLPHALIYEIYCLRRLSEWGYLVNPNRYFSVALVHAVLGPVSIMHDS